jgi:DNA-directed RNA polymerase
MAVITLDTVLKYILRSANLGVKVTQLALDISELLETEVNLINIKQKHIKETKEKNKELNIKAPTNTLPMWKKNILKDPTKNMKSIESLNKKLRKITNDEEWKKSDKVKIGAALINLIIKSAKTDTNDYVFKYSVDFSKGKRSGMIRLNDIVYDEIGNKVVTDILPRFLPMLVPPKSWDNRKYHGL